MTKTLKKTLAIVVALALCLSAFMGCFSVSAADTDTITATVTGSTVTEGAEEVTVTIDIASTGFAAALLDISFGGLNIKADDDGEPAIAVTSTSDAGYDEAAGTWDSKIVYQHNSFVDGVANVSAANDTNDGIRLIIDGAEEEYADAQLVLTFVTPAVGEYTVAISELEAADYGTYENNAWTNTEDIIETVTINQDEKNVVVNAAHVHEYSKVNYDETNHWNECPADNAVDEGSVTEHTLSEAAEGEDGKWYKSCTCGYKKEVDAPHTHSYTSAVTTRPTTTTTGVRTYTCECGETYTETIDIPTAITDVNIGKNISLASNIVVGFTVPNTYTKSADIVDYYAIVEKNLYAGSNVVDVDVQEFAKTDFVYHSAKRDKFLYAGITAKDMTNEIRVVVYFEYNDGTFKSLSLNYKLTDYVDGVIAEYADTFETVPANRSLITLLMNMLVYGEAAQVHFSNYNSANMPTANYTDYLQFASTHDIVYGTSAANNTLEGATHKLNITLAVGSSIAIKSRVRLADNTEFSSPSDLEGYYAKCVIQGQESEPVIIYPTEFEFDGSTTYIVFDKFTTRQKSAVVSITLCDADGNAVSNTRTYSIESYAKAVADEQAPTTTLRTLTDAMIRFCDIADKYFSGDYT